MRTLSEDMLLAQQWQPLWNVATGLGRPLVRVRIKNTRGCATLYEWARWYEGDEDLGSHGVALPSDGSLVRVRIDPDDNKIYVQRVTSPGEGSTYSNWTDTGETGIAVAIAANGSDLIIAYIEDTFNRDIYCKYSFDSGASWAVGVDSGLDADSAGALAVCMIDSGEQCLIWSRGHNIYGSTRNGGAWAAEDDSGLSFTQLTGLAVHRTPAGSADWNIVLTAERTAEVWGVYQTIWGDGYSVAPGNWDSIRTILEREETELFEYYAPTVDETDVYRLAFVEKYVWPTERIHVFWSHAPKSTDFVQCLWHEPVPFNYSEQTGLTMAHNATDVFLCAPDAVYYADATPVTFDVTNDVLQIKQILDPERTTSKLTVVLDNTAGTYNDFAKLGWAMILELGYHTLTGDEYSATPHFWITGWSNVSPSWFPLRAFYPTGVLGTIQIRAESMWNIMKRWRARRAIEWDSDAETIFNILSWVLARVGFRLSNESGDSELSNLKPNFRINRNYNARWAVQNLLNMLKCKGLQRDDYFRLIAPPTDLVSDYEYDSHYGDATILYRGSYGQGFQDPNYAEYEAELLSEAAFEFDDILSGYDRYQLITKPDYNASARAQYRVEREIGAAKIRGAHYGWVQTPINAVLEPYDVVTLTDDAGGVSSIVRLALRIDTLYTKRAYTFHQKLTLGHCPAYEPGD